MQQKSIPIYYIYIYIYIICVCVCICICTHTLSEIKVQKLSLGRYLFKRYMFVPKGSILVPQKVHIST